MYQPENSTIWHFKNIHSVCWWNVQSTICLQLKLPLCEAWLQFQMYASDLFQCALLNIICGKWVLRKICLRAQNHNATARYVIYLLCCVRYAGTCSSYYYYRPYLFVRKATAIRHNHTKARKEWLIAEWGLILCSSKKIIEILWQNSARGEDEVTEKETTCGM